MAKTQTRPQPSKNRPQARPKSGPRKKQQQPWYREYTWLPWVVGGVVLGFVVIALRSGQTDAPAPGVAVSKPVVGGDLHSLVMSPDDPGKLYIGSHQGVSVSSDGGETWEVVESLNGADAMGWAFTDDAIMVGGHPGLSVSTDGGKSFEQRNDGLPSFRCSNDLPPSVETLSPGCPPTMMASSVKAHPIASAPLRLSTTSHVSPPSLDTETPW